MPTETSAPHARAALIVLIVLHVTMLAALMTRTPPHPPLEIALFALAPFLGASLALMAAALHLGPTRTKAGIALSTMSILAALISFGPQKWIDPAFPAIWPAVVTAQIAVIVLAWSLWNRVAAGRPSSTSAS